MRQSKYALNALLISNIIFFMICAYFVSKEFEKPPIFITKQQSSFNIDKKFLNYFHLGQKRLFSSLFWIATILESDHDHYKAHDLNSWMYLRFLTISHLEPKFLYNYIFGGIYLSIIKDDLNGASDIFNRGLALFPNEYSLLQDAGFHFYFEANNYKQALPIYEKLSTYSKAPPFIYSILARLRMNNGSIEDAYSLLMSKYIGLQDKESLIAKVIRNHLFNIKTEIDLNCLNSLKKNCSYIDLDGDPYLKAENNLYFTKKKWKKFKVKTKPTPFD